MANRYTKDIVSGADTLSAGFNFKVIFNHVVTFGFQSVSGIRVSRPVDFIPEGGVNDHQLMVGQPQQDTPELTFSRGLILKASQIVTTAAKAAVAQIPDNSARKAAFIALNTVDPQEMLENGPAYGEIEVYSTTEKGKKIGLYSFFAIGIKEWSLSDLSGTDSSALIENFSVMHTGLRRLPLSPPLGQYYFHTENNNYSDAQERTPVEGNLAQKNQETIEEMAKSNRAASNDGSDNSLIDANKEVAEQMAKSKAENDKISSDISNQLQDMKEKMAQDYSNYQADVEEYEENRKEGLQKSEELKEHARQKAEKYKKWAEDLTDKIIKAEGSNLKSVQKRAKELSQIASQASEIAQKSLNALAIKLSDFREKQKQKAEDLKEKEAEVEKAKNAAIQASILARQMADSVRENSRKLQSGAWEKIKEQNEQEIAKVQGQSTVSDKGKDNKQSEDSNEQNSQNSNESQNNSPAQKENQASGQSNKENPQNTQESQSKSSNTQESQSKSSNTQESQSKSSQSNKSQSDKSTDNENSQNKSSQPDNDSKNEQKKAKSWDEIKEQNLKEMQKLQDEFNKLRQQGSEDAQKKAEEVKELLEKNQKQVEEIEKKKQEFEQKREEFKKMSKSVSDDAEETSAEAENSADEVDAMIENAA